MPSAILTVVGPTASGKTALALRLAREHHAEIISADSRQVYRHLSIGTAKPAGEWAATDPPAYLVEGVPYHLVDMREPDQPFTAADFVRLATDTIQAIRRRGKTPLLAGGTGFYLKALADGLAPLPPADPELRAALRRRASEEGRKTLHAELARVDPEAAAQIPANNIQRLIRALEVFYLTQTPLSAWHREHQSRRNAHPQGEGVALRCVGLALPKDELATRIERRCRAMLEGGLIEETRALLARGYRTDCPALTGLGYPRVIAHLNGELTRAQLLEHLIRDTRRYAKRQMTWFRHQLPVEWPAGAS